MVACTAALADVCLGLGFWPASRLLVLSWNGLWERLVAALSLGRTWAGLAVVCGPFPWAGLGLVGVDLVLWSFFVHDTLDDH